MEAAISLGHERGHILNIADQFSIGDGSFQGPLVFCVMCGSYSVRRCKDLKKDCPGLPQKGPKERCAAAFTDHLHPNDKGIRLQGFRTIRPAKVNHPPTGGSPPKATMGNHMLEPDVWFDQDEEIDFGFLEEESLWESGWDGPPDS